MSRFQPRFSSYRPHDALFDDEQLAGRVAVFLVDRIPAAAHIDISVSGGRVFLRGRVVDQRTRSLAESCSRRVAGVLNVNNELTVAGRPPLQARRAAKRKLALTPAPLRDLEPRTADLAIPVAPAR